MSQDDSDSLGVWGSLGALFVLAVIFTAISTGYKYLMSPAGESIRVALEVLLLGVTFIGSILWQVYLVREDDGEFPQRLMIPLAISSCLLVGAMIRGVLRLVDGHVQAYGFKAFTLEIFAIALFAMILVFKTYLGLVFLGSTLIQLIYNGFEFHQVWAIRLAWHFIEIVLPGLPNYAETIYVVIAVLTSFSACTWESAAHYT